MVETHLRASIDAQRAGDFDAMLESARRACEASSGDLKARFRLLECLLYCGLVDEVRESLGQIERAADSNDRLLAQVAEFHTHCADHAAALRCYKRALRLRPDAPEYHFAVSAALLATGDIDTAEKHLDEAIRLNPADYDAYRNRATLRRQTEDDNHIEELEAVLSAGVPSPNAAAQICYALAKECEDLGQDERAFDYLKRGADARRSVLQYRVDEDLAVMLRLREVFDESLLARDDDACDELGPVFVMGLPRSGTTLVDRILGSHSQVDSLGEINNFAYALMHTIGKSASKLELIDLSASMNFAELGQRYVDSIRRYGNQSPYLIDKTPLNYLYVGLICKALPNARIIHVERNAMDSCYGMYRTLFRAGYPFSYDLEDLGRYYIGYRSLVDHWRDVCGDAVHWLRYEALVDDQEQTSKALIEYCGLDWEDACLEFHKNTSAVMTASSAQVRRPVYRDALQRWRRYEQQLEPLRRLLESNGIAIDGG